MTGLWRVEGERQLSRFQRQGEGGADDNLIATLLTGLGSALWVVDHYRDRPAIALNGLRQYLNYFFTSVAL